MDCGKTSPFSSLSTCQDLDDTSVEASSQTANSMPRLSCRSGARPNFFEPFSKHFNYPTMGRSATRKKKFRPNPLRQISPAPCLYLHVGAEWLLHHEAHFSISLFGRQQPVLAGEFLILCSFLLRPSRATTDFKEQVFLPQNCSG